MVKMQKSLLGEDRKEVLNKKNFQSQKESKELKQGSFKNNSFNTAKVLDPMALGKLKEKKVYIPFASSFAWLSSDSHPKNIRQDMPVPKLWELKPIKKLEKKMEWQAQLNKVKQVRLSEVKEYEKKKVEKVVYHFPQETSHLKSLSTSQSLIRSRKVSAESVNEIIEKLKEVYKSEI